MNSYQKYRKTYTAAQRADSDKNFRLAADKFWQAFRLAPDGVWTKYRLVCLECYVHYLGEDSKILVPTKKDYENLETSIVNNEDEANVFRAHAALCLGVMYFNFRMDFEESAEWLRRGIDFCDSASPEEKERVVMIMGDGPARGRQLSEVIDTLKEWGLQVLAKMEGCEARGDRVDVQEPVRSPWCVFPRAMLVPIFGDIPTELMERRMATGGATCDCCGASRDSTGLTNLLTCAKCTMAYYCSKECQVEQWKRRGHKKACRKPREFHAGDIVRCFSDDLDSIYMYRLKRLVDGENRDGTRKWEAYVATWTGKLSCFVVEESKLHHIRPADII